jgi:hypothetical protein
MATLHVRNFPEPLYDALRAAAEDNGRSIAAMSVALLNESLSTGRRGFPFFGRRGGEPAPLQAFGDEARAAIVDAEALAREFGHAHVGTDVLLLALVVGHYGALPVSTGTVAEAVRERIERGAGAPAGPLPFGPDAKQALELALRESLKARCAAIGPVHLLVGVSGASGRGSEIFEELGLGQAALRQALLHAAAGPRISTTMLLQRDYRVVELEGTAADWEDALLDVSGRGYDLVEVVGTRAIFRLRRP